ncbi:MAG: formyltransferase family protein [Acidobacteriota bacterium]
MRIAYFANNRLGADVADYLREQGDEVVALVLHPADRRRFGEEILAATGVEPDRVFDASRLDGGDVRDAIASAGAEMGLSVLFGYLLRRPLIDLFPRGCVNLHPAYLPYNRGAYPNVWSIVEGTPAGVTLHVVDEGIDTGEILCQKTVAVSPSDTGQSLYRKLEAASLELFREGWPRVRAGQIRPIPQGGEGTAHYVRDVEKIDAIDLDTRYTARHLIDILRARTFPPYRGAYFRDGRRKIFVEIRLTVEGSD